MTTSSEHQEARHKSAGGLPHAIPRQYENPEVYHPSLRSEYQPDLEGFNVVFQEHSELLEKMIRHTVGGQAVEDVLQETWANAASGAGAVSRILMMDTEEQRRYLCRVARNTSINWLRQEGRIPMADQYYDHDHSPIDHLVDGSDMAQEVVDKIVAVAWLKARIKGGDTKTSHMLQELTGKGVSQADYAAAQSELSPEAKRVTTGAVKMDLSRRRNLLNIEPDLLS